MAIPTGFGERAGIEEARPKKSRSRQLDRFLYALRHDWRWWLGIVLLVFVLGAIFAPIVSPYDPLRANPELLSQGASMAHWLGTDAIGRDQLSRVIWGGRISLSVGISVILLGGIFGTVLGVLAAYFKGWVDQVISMVIDAVVSFPPLILAFAIVAALGPSVLNIAIALAIVRIPIYARLARGQTLQTAAQDYVMGARVSGTPAWKIMLKHILPNIFSPLLVQATVTISFAILDATILSFLGLGVQPPTPDWGAMINEARTDLFTAPFIMVGPSLAIVIVVLCLNLFGDAVRDLLDPRDAPRIISAKEEAALKDRDEQRREAMTARIGVGD